MRVRPAEGGESEFEGVGGTSHVRAGVLVLLALIGSAMVTSVLLYLDGAGTRRMSTNVPLPSSGTTVTLSVESVQSDYGAILCNLAVTPGSALVDPATDGLRRDLTVEVSSSVAPLKRTWSRGTLPGVFPIPLTLARDAERWPFDQYYTGPIRVELFVGAAQTPERASVTFVDRLPGWKVHASQPDSGRPFATYLVEMQRAPSTMVFAVVILCVLVAIAGAAVFVAIQTLRDRRKFQSPMTTWYAAMLFAVVPLRNALPGSPAFGSWVDMTIVLWVLVALVISMLLYIACWWRHLRPAPSAEQQTQGVPSGTISAE